MLQKHYFIMITIYLSRSYPIIFNISVINSHLNDVVIGKGKEMLCSIEDDFTEKLNIASIVVIS